MNFYIRIHLIMTKSNFFQLQMIKHNHSEDPVVYFASCLPRHMSYVNYKRSMLFKQIAQTVVNMGNIALENLLLIMVIVGFIDSG